MIARAFLARLTLALVALTNATEASCGSSYGDVAAIKNDVRARLGEPGAGAVLCEYDLYRSGQVFYRVKHRWTDATSTALETSLWAIAMSYRAAIETKAWPRPMRCIVISSQKRSIILPVENGCVSHHAGAISLDTFGEWIAEYAKDRETQQH